MVICKAIQARKPHQSLFLKGQISITVWAQITANEASHRRKLPKVDPSLTVKLPIDNPALHQGRTRSIPHVEGQFAAYVYLPIALDENQSLWTLLNSAIRRAKQLEPALICNWTDVNGSPRELHISLTRTMYLRGHQRDELKRAVKAAAYTREPCVTRVHYDGIPV